MVITAAFVTDKTEIDSTGCAQEARKVQQMSAAPHCTKSAGYVHIMLQH